MQIEIRQIPVVKVPSPNAAKYLVSIQPTTAALITEYIGWNIIPMIGQTLNFVISHAVLHVLIVGGHFGLAA